MSAYADDLLIARSARNKDMIVASLPPEIDKVVAWSDKARLTLSTSKCEIVFFNLDCVEAAWQPNITIGGKRMFSNPFPVFLGVRYDRQFTCARHVRRLCHSMSGRFNLLRALRGTTLGWHISDVRQVNIAIGRSMIEYSAAAWASWLSATFTSKIENVQLWATRAITGLVRSTPVETVLALSQLPLYQPFSSLHGTSPSPYANSHHTSWQEHVTIPAERPFASRPCHHSPSGVPDLQRWFGSALNRGRRCRFGSPRPR